MFTKLYIKLKLKELLNKDYSNHILGMKILVETDTFSHLVYETQYTSL